MPISYQGIGDSWYASVPCQIYIHFLGCLDVLAIRLAICIEFPSSHLPVLSSYLTPYSNRYLLQYCLLFFFNRMSPKTIGYDWRLLISLCISMICITCWREKICPAFVVDSHCKLLQQRCWHLWSFSIFKSPVCLVLCFCTLRLVIFAPCTLCMQWQRQTFSCVHIAGCFQMPSWKS